MDGTTRGVGELTLLETSTIGRYDGMDVHLRWGI